VNPVDLLKNSYGRNDRLKTKKNHALHLIFVKKSKFFVFIQHYISFRVKREILLSNIPVLKRSLPVVGMAIYSLAFQKNSETFTAYNPIFHFNAQHGTV
jgi:hypothetical protein